MWQPVSNQVFVRFEDSMTLSRTQDSGLLHWLTGLLVLIVPSKCRCQ